MRSIFGMIWHLLAYWITFILGAFYKRIQVKNLGFLKVKGPVIIAMNHPNAFTDPIAISYVCHPLRLHYMARGDAFKPGIVSWLLEQIGIVPIFRIQDGGLEGLKKNDAAYRKVNALLKRNAKVIVFAEGLCVQERRLRPLKKGISRMVFGAYETLGNDALIVLPVGINYSQPDRFGSDLFYNIGEPIAVKDYYAQYKENPAKTNLAFLQLLQSKMKDLITHVNDQNNDQAVLDVETLAKNSLMAEQHLNSNRLDDDLLALKQLTEKVNRASVESPALLNEFKTSAKTYFAELRNNKLPDWVFDPFQNKKLTISSLFFRSILVLVSFPLYGFGLLGNYLPYYLSKSVAQKTVKGKKEFYSSIFLGVAMVFFLLNYLLWFLAIRFFCSNSITPVIVCLAFAVCAQFVLHYQPFLKKTIEMLRFLKKRGSLTSLENQRKNLISLINKF